MQIVFLFIFLTVFGFFIGILKVLELQFQLWNSIEIVVVTPEAIEVWLFEYLNVGFLKNKASLTNMNWRFPLPQFWPQSQIQ